VPENGVYSFVDGIEPALAAAKRAAGDKGVTVMGSADIRDQVIPQGQPDRRAIVAYRAGPVRLGHEDVRRRDGVGSPAGTALRHPHLEGIHLRARVVR
jgi:hypothetical protein